MPNHGASDLYTAGAGKLISGGIDWDTDTFAVALIDTADYTADLANDEFLSDIPGAAIVSTSASLTGLAAVGNLAQADPARFPATTGDVAEALVVYKDTGVAATSSLLVYIDTTITGLPITPTGRGITISWNNSTVFGLDIGADTDIQIFTATDTWYKPDGNFTSADVILIGGGGGGGSGDAPSGGTAEGAGGGSCGGYSAATVPFALLGNTETVTVGTGGTGAAARVWVAAGLQGSTGNPSTFSILSAGGGPGGVGGGSSGGTGGLPAPDMSGTTYRGAQGATNGVAAATPDRCCGGGGASGGTGPSASSAGGNNEDNATGAGTAGVGAAAGGVGGDYTPSPSYAFKRGGGGGGGSAQNGYRAGGYGGVPGGGGGGGGGGYQGTSGRGGDGGRGVVTIVCRVD